MRETDSSSWSGLNKSQPTGRLAGRQVGVPAGRDTALVEMVARIAGKNLRLSRVGVSGASGSGNEPSRASGSATAQRNRNRVVEELERERARIARDLHAGAGQPLAGIKLNLDILDGCAESMSTDAKEAMGRLHLLTESALAEVRAVSHRLHPPDWQTLTTSQAIRHLLSEIGAEACFMVTDFDIPELSLEPEHTARIALYRCAQEGIANVIRHSGATRLEVSLGQSGDEVELLIRDNGKGIEKKPGSRGGLGLGAMREHAAAGGGECKIETGIEGTTITIRIPLASD